MTQLAPHDPGDYTSALSELHRLLLNYQSAKSFLRQASCLTARTVGSGLSCSILLQPGGHALAVATSDPLATLTEQVQESTGQGPSLRCLRWQHPVHVDDLAEDSRWPLFALRATEMGIRSCLCLPLRAPGTTGALSLYAPAPRAFDAGQVSRVSTFAGYLASAIVIGVRQDGLRVTIGQLRTALASRAVIDQALGVLMTREHCGISQAVALLHAGSQHRHVKLRDLARQIVAEAASGPPQLPPVEIDPPAPGKFLAAPAGTGQSRNDEERRKGQPRLRPVIGPRQAVTSSLNSNPAGALGGMRQSAATTPDRAGTGNRRRPADMPEQPPATTLPPDNKEKVSSARRPANT